MWLTSLQTELFKLNSLDIDLSVLNTQVRVLLKKSKNVQQTQSLNLMEML